MSQLVVVDEFNISRSYKINRELTIGSAQTNKVILPSSVASPRQIVIKVAKKGFILTNLDPKNKLFINNKPYRIKALQHGDMISLANIVMFFDEEEAKEEKEKDSETVDDQEEKTPTVSKRQQQYDNVETAVENISKSGGADKKLATLLKFGATAFDEMDYKKLLAKVMDMIFHIFPADKGSIWIAEDQSNRLTPQIYRIHDKYMPTDKVKISKSIIQEVFKKKESTLTIDAQQDARFFSGQSIAEQNIKSAMAAPLMRKKKIFGLIQIDTTSTRSFTQEHLELFSAITLQAAMAIDNARLYKEVTEKRSMEDELSLAHSIQQSLMPREIPNLNGLEIYGKMIPAKHVGGDYYDFIPGPNENHHYFCIGDVSGKGVGAALGMVMARSTLRPLISSCPSTKEVIEKLNLYLCESLHGKFMTFFLLQWDSHNGKLVGCGAGHEHLIYYHSNTKKSELIRAGGRALGLSAESGKPYQERDIMMEWGDALILYTDGVTECRNTEGELFGLDYLLEIIDYHGYLNSQGICDAIISELESYRGEAPQADDITILIIKRQQLSPPARS